MSNPQHTSVTPPPALLGFEHISRTFDHRVCAFTAHIAPGEFYVSPHGEIISTYLGSCISVCIRDRKTAVGGMNHFMLPQKSERDDSWNNSVVSESARYGDWAMEKLLNELYKAGAKKNRLEIKVFGGGKVISGMRSSVGEQNIKFALDFLEREGFAVDAMDVGDVYPRRLFFFTETGKVKVRKMTEKPSDILEGDCPEFCVTVYH